MSLSSYLSIPLLVLVATAGPVYWALPESLGTARTLGIMTGWAGCGLLLSSLLLMLREPRLARGLGGLDRMYRWHHRTGTAAYVLLLAHPLLLAAESWPTDPRSAWQTLSPLSQGWPVWLGWLALLLLMAGLAVTFDKRIPYRVWRSLHVGLGLGVIVGLLHLVLLGIETPVWPVIGLAVVLLGWRFVGEDAGLAAHPYVVESSMTLAKDMVEVSLKPLAEPLGVAPGQFVLVAFFPGPAYRGCGEFHPFTVSGAGADGVLRVGIKALGDCTRAIQAVGPGVPARIQGAFGSFLAEPSHSPQLWVAGGLGITPFVARLRDRPLERRTLLLYLYRAEAEAAFLAELRATAVTDPQLFFRGIAAGDGVPDLDLVLPDAATLAGHECYVCGPPAMVAGVRAVLQRRGIEPRHLHLENFEFR